MQINRLNINNLKYPVIGKYKACNKAEQTILSNAIFNNHNIMRNCNLTFSGSGKAFYAIREDGSYQRFTDRKTAENELSLAKTNIAECLQGKRNNTHGFGFIYADEIETDDKNGQNIVDKEKLKTAVDRLINSIAATECTVPVYAVDEKGKWRKFPSKYQASKALDINTPRIIRCLNKELNKTGGYTFVFPEEIETIDEQGQTIVDIKKLREFVSSAFTDSSMTSVYAIDSKGFYRKYSGVRKAARELGLDSVNISKCLNGKQKRAGEYTFVRSKDVERLDNYGNVIIDTAKIKEINYNSFQRKGAVPIYVISPDGSFKKYDSKKQAAQSIGIENTDINHCLDGRYTCFKGYAFALADDVEISGENGRPKINYGLIKEKYTELNKNAVYAIHKDGSYKKYMTQTEAAKSLGLRRTKISQCINGESTKVSDYTFVKASDVESFDNGKITINTTLLKKFALELASSGLKAVYVFDPSGHYTRYDSTKSIAEDLSLSKSGIKECLRGKQDKSKGYIFMYADNFEKADENGNIIIDYDKLDEISAGINPDLARQMTKYGKIYAVNGITTQEFENVRKASRALNIDENLIIYYLKNGRNSQNGEMSINGLVFTCECDI